MPLHRQPVFLSTSDRKVVERSAAGHPLEDQGCRCGRFRCDALRVTARIEWRWTPGVSPAGSSMSRHQPTIRGWLCGSAAEESLAVPSLSGQGSPRWQRWRFDRRHQHVLLDHELEDVVLLQGEVPASVVLLGAVEVDPLGDVVGQTPQFCVGRSGRRVQDFVTRSQSGRKLLYRKKKRMST